MASWGHSVPLLLLAILLLLLLRPVNAQTTLDVSTAPGHVINASNTSYAAGLVLQGFPGTITLQNIVTTTINVASATACVLLLQNVSCTAISFFTLAGCYVSMVGVFVTSTGGTGGIAVANSVTTTMFRISSSAVRWNMGTAGSLSGINVQSSWTQGSIVIDSTEISITTTGSDVNAVHVGGSILNIGTISIVNSNVTVTCNGGGTLLLLSSSVTGTSLSVSNVTISNTTAIVNAMSGNLLYISQTVTSVLVLLQNNQIVAGFVSLPTFATSLFVMANTNWTGGTFRVAHASSSNVTFDTVNMTVRGQSGVLTVFDLSSSQSWDSSSLSIQGLTVVGDTTGAAYMIVLPTTTSSPLLYVANSFMSLSGTSVSGFSCSLLQASPRLVILSSTFNLTATASTAVGITMTVTTVNNVYLNSNSFLLHAISSATAFVLTDVQHMDRLEIRHNHIDIKSTSSTAIAYRATSYMDYVSVFAFEYNWVSCFGTGNSAVMSLGSQWDPVTLFSMRNNDAVVSVPTSGSAFFFVLQAYAQNTYFAFTNNSARINGDGASAIFSFSTVTGMHQCSLTMAFNVFNGSAQLSSAPFAATSTSYVRDVCNIGNASTVLPPTSTTGPFNYTTASCGACLLDVQCYSVVASVLGKVNGECTCQCKTGGATTTLFTPFEDQCTNLDTPPPSTTVAPTTTALPTTTSTTNAPTTTLAPTTTGATTLSPLTTVTSTLAATATPVPTTVAATTTMGATTTNAPTTTNIVTTAVPITTAATTAAPNVTNQTVYTPSVTETAAGGAVVAGTAIAGAGAVTPGWSAHASRNAMLATLVDCPQPFDPEDKLNPIESPSGIAIGDHDTKQYLGAIVVNGSFVIAMIVAQLLIGLVFHLCRKPPEEGLPPHTLSRSLLIAKLPRANYIWFMLFLQPFTHCGLVMMAFSNNDPGDFVIGATTFIVSQFLTAYMVYQITSNRLRATFVEEEDYAEWSCLRRIFFASGEWEPGETEPERIHHKLFKPLYAPFRPIGSAFIMTDMMMALAMGILSSMLPSTDAECLYQAVAITVFSALYWLAVVVVRPFAAPVDNFLLASLAFVEMLNALFLAIYMADQEGNEWSKGVATTLSNIDVYFTFSLIIKDCILAAVKQVLKRRDAKHHSSLERHVDVMVYPTNDGGEPLPVNPVPRRRVAFEHGPTAVPPSPGERMHVAMTETSEDDWDEHEEGLFYCARLGVFWDSGRGHYFDEGAQQWYDPDTGEWLDPPNDGEEDDEVQWDNNDDDDNGGDAPTDGAEEWVEADDDEDILLPRNNEEIEPDDVGSDLYYDYQAPYE